MIRPRPTACKIRLDVVKKSIKLLIPSRVNLIPQKLQEPLCERIFSGRQDQSFVAAHTIVPFASAIMRFSFFATALLSATAFAAPSAKAEAADLAVRSPNALPVPAPAPEALPIANAAAAPSVDDLAPLLNNLMSRSLEERQDILSSITGLISDLGPIIQAVLSLLNAETINDIHSIVTHAADLLDDQAEPAAKNLILQANRLLTPNNTDILVNLLNDVAPLLNQLGPLISGISSLLSSLLGIFLPHS
ncbi:uncharacterized protein PV09_06417 [Verruconis gallopava]|uniref:Uncharacterized protein n=1 Tax=Verruconis gallopava TaxID=253628 RepID=A0A0D1YNG9_9PEZI|nr:uncharacterized protein PV09_06417 [Verruconis gallopava]KIW02267.1 hypothetical protein PV09_06417 [Verruconis gallopava]